MQNRDIDPLQIGLRIQAARRQAGLSQHELANLAQVSTSYIGHIERGLKHGSVETIAVICRILHLSADYVLFGKEIKQDRNAIICAYLEEQLDLLRKSIVDCSTEG